jgi:hypothetical protein
MGNSYPTTKTDGSNSRPAEQPSAKSCLKDLSSSMDLRKLGLTPVRDSRWDSYVWILPAQLEEVELSIPEAMVDCRFEIQAQHCENLERM